MHCIVKAGSTNLYGMFLYAVLLHVSFLWNYKDQTCFSMTMPSCEQSEIHKNMMCPGWSEKTQDSWPQLKQTPWNWNTNQVPRLYAQHPDMLHVSIWTPNLKNAHVAELTET